MAQYLIALGANLPPVGIASGELSHLTQNLYDALSRIATMGLHPGAVSQMFATPAWPPGTGPDYVNAAAALDSDLLPRQVLDLLHRAEAEMGRERRVRWGERVIDLDLLAAGQIVSPDLATYQRWRDLPPSDQATRTPDRLILPHPRLQDRAFVLVPLAQIAPDWRHPVLGRTVRQMRDALPRADRDAVRPIQVRPCQ